MVTAEQAKALADSALERLQGVAPREKNAEKSVRRTAGLVPDREKNAEKSSGMVSPPRPDGACPGCGGKPSPGSRLLLCGCGWAAPEVEALAASTGGAATLADRLFVRTMPQRRQVCRRYLLFLLDQGPIDGREAQAGWPGPVEDLIAVEAELGAQVLLVGGLADGVPAVYLVAQEAEVRRMQRVSARMAPELRRELRDRTRRRVAAWWGE